MLRSFEVIIHIFKSYLVWPYYDAIATDKGITYLNYKYRNIMLSNFRAFM